MGAKQFKTRHRKSAIHFEPSGSRRKIQLRRSANIFSPCGYSEGYAPQGFSLNVIEGWRSRRRVCCLDSDVIQLQVQGVTDIVYRMIDALKYPGGRSDPWPDRAAREKFLWFQGELSTIYSNISSLYHEFVALTVYSNSILSEHSVTYNSKRYTIYMSRNHPRTGDVMY